MTTVTSLTAARMIEIEQASVVDGNIVGNNLILVTKGGAQINAGNVQGPTGAQGIQGPAGTAGEKQTVGMLADFPKLPLPAGWLECDGSIKNIVDYPLLGAYLGTTYGGNGTTTFGLPSYAGLARVGRDAGQPEFDAVGETGGVKKHTLTIAELPVHSHAHTLVPAQHSHGMWHTHMAAGNLAFWVNTPGGYGGLSGSGPVSPVNTTSSPVERNDTDGANVLGLNGGISNTGSGTSHNNLQPYRVIITAIKT
jgi:microcystin-dependent protein